MGVMGKILKDGDWVIGIKGPRLGCVAKYLDKQSITGCYTVQARFPGTLRAMCCFGGDEPACGGPKSWWRPMTEHEVKFYINVAIPKAQSCPKCGSSGGIHKTDCPVVASGAMKVEAPDGDAFVMSDGDNGGWDWMPFWTRVKRYLFEPGYDLSQLRKTLGMGPSMLKFLEEIMERDESGEM